MAKAKKKPAIIDYFDVVDVPDQLEQIRKFVNGFGDDFRDVFELTTHPLHVDIRVKTLEGTSYQISTDDVIIRGVKGEYYPCKRDIFLQTYDILED